MPESAVAGFVTTKTPHLHTMQETTTSGGGGSILGTLFALAILILIIASMWRVFTKAGQPGWAVFIPIYNVYVLCKVAGKPGWWVLLMLIPVVGFIIAILVTIGVAQQFGKGSVFSIGLILLPFIFYPLLAFGDATYGGAATA